VVSRRPPNEPAYFDEPLNPKTKSCEVELPDPQASQSYQQSTIGEQQGMYDAATNSCLTYCADVLNAGGLDVPTSPVYMSEHDR
jgi:hypothetical protein